MIKVDFDKAQFEKMFLEKVEEHLKDMENELLLWDTKELKRQTRMSWNTIQDTFFHDPRFPKFKVGGKWYYPAKEAKKFILNWLKEQKEE